ncbi:MAG: hypothetical protein LBR68_03730 [Lachnoclostridium sp.]|nr:hypothetical protein [Lachnoclostridium sp.]
MNYATKVNAITRAIDMCVDLTKKGVKCEVHFYTSAGIINYNPGDQSDKNSSLIESEFSFVNGKKSESEVNEEINEVILKKACLYTYMEPNYRIEISPLFLFFDNIIGVSASII